MTCHLKDIHGIWQLSCHWTNQSIVLQFYRLRIFNIAYLVGFCIELALTEIYRMWVNDLFLISHITVIDALIWIDKLKAPLYFLQHLTRNWNQANANGNLSQIFNWCKFLCGLVLAACTSIGFVLWTHKFLLLILYSRNLLGPTCYAV